MHDVSPPSFQGRADGRQLGEALAQLERMVVDGIRHGFFRCSITCTIHKGGRRELVVEAGKSHKFTIPEDEVPC
jgi:hypothetical protein